MNIEKLKQAIELMELLNKEKSEKKSQEGKYVVVRTYSAGVHAGAIESISPENKEITLTDVRRIWYWKGANDLNDLATNGVKNPDECKFSCVLSRNTIPYIEILDTTKEAEYCIKGVPVWKA